ncbi:MAG: hypothetical protein LF885_06120 [Rickettsia endosymbiont of Culicoides impunctatus]|nr:MAG: hypothetical protein LF885_06120 [Rickettsia endosymbiont of Culicoides impunctatus]
MTKLKQSNYLDQAKTLIRTANNLYDHALDGLSKVNIIIEEHGLTPEVISGSKAMHFELKEALLFGKGEAAAGLAYLYREGLGVEKSKYKDKLYVSIGAKLGDSSCQELLPQRNHKDVELEAEKWLKAIKVITKKYPNKDAEITSADTVWAQGQLEYHCKEPQPLYPILPHNEGGASTGSMHPLGQVDETAMTGRDSEDSSCCVVM